MCLRLYTTSSCSLRPPSMTAQPERLSAVILIRNTPIDEVAHESGQHFPPIRSLRTCSWSCQLFRFCSVVSICAFDFRNPFYNILLVRVLPLRKNSRWLRSLGDKITFGVGNFGSLYPMYYKSTKHNIRL